MISASMLKKCVAKQTYLQLREKVNGNGVGVPEAKPLAEKKKVADGLIKKAFK
jgi:hypothetical protein